MIVRPHNRSSRRSGLTLVEVLATISVMSIVIPVIMQGISIATSLASVTRQRAEAVSLGGTWRFQLDRQDAGAMTPERSLQREFHRPAMRPLPASNAKRVTEPPLAFARVRLTMAPGW